MAKSGTFALLRLYLQAQGAEARAKELNDRLAAGYKKLDAEEKKAYDAQRAALTKAGKE